MAADPSLCRWILHAALLFCCCDALIIPQELPSILSLIYSNLPPLKKGTDSRLGFGFRFGEHADFQVLIQLGPQSETQPIGPQPENNGNSKRHVIRQTFYTPNGEEIITDTQGGKWLSSWRSEFTNKKKVNLQETTTEKAIMVADPTQSRNQVVTHLRKLYHNTTDNSTNTGNFTQVE
nr:snustorr snarlik [Locusta migratoria]